MKKCVDLLNTKEYSLLIDTTFKNNDLPNVNLKYVVQKIYIPTPPPLRPRGYLSLCSLQPAGISFPGLLVLPPPPNPLEFP